MVPSQGKDPGNEVELNALPPGQQEASNARGMPGGMFKLRFD